MVLSRLCKKLFAYSIVGAALVIGAGFVLDGGDVAVTLNQPKAALGHSPNFGEKALMKPGRYKVGKPYTIKGVTYTPATNFQYIEEGLASWYGPGFHGKETANGEIYDMYSISAAHKTLQMPAIVRVTNLDNGRALLVRVNDRGPYHTDNRIIDLSYAAAKKLGFDKKGIARVRVEALADHSLALAAQCQGKTVAALQKEMRCARGVKLAAREAPTNMA